MTYLGQGNQNYKRACFIRNKLCFKFPDVSIIGPPKNVIWINNNSELECFDDGYDDGHDDDDDDDDDDDEDDDDEEEEEEEEDEDESDDDEQ